MLELVRSAVKVIYCDARAHVTTSLRRGLGHRTSSVFANATLKAKAHFVCFSYIFDYEMTERVAKRAGKTLSPTIGTASLVADSSFDTEVSTFSSRNVDDAIDPPLAVGERNSSGRYSSNGESANLSGSERPASVPGSDFAEGGKDHKKKIRRRRGHGRRKWKPYHKLSTEEKRELADREEKRAEKSRAER